MVDLVQIYGWAEAHAAIATMLGMLLALFAFFRFTFKMPVIISRKRHEALLRSEKEAIKYKSKCDEKESNLQSNNRRIETLMGMLSLALKANLRVPAESAFPEAEGSQTLELPLVIEKK